MDYILLGLPHRFLLDSPGDTLGTIFLSNSCSIPQSMMSESCLCCRVELVMKWAGIHRKCGSSYQIKCRRGGSIPIMRVIFTTTKEMDRLSLSLFSNFLQPSPLKVFHRRYRKDHFFHYHCCGFMTLIFSFFIILLK